VSGTSCATASRGAAIAWPHGATGTGIATPGTSSQAAPTGRPRCRRDLRIRMTRRHPRVGLGRRQALPDVAGAPLRVWPSVSTRSSRVPGLRSIQPRRTCPAQVPAGGAFLCCHAWLGGMIRCIGRSSMQA
jgi:hypothetical protein